MGDLSVHVAGASLRTYTAGYSGVKMTTTARGCGVLSWRVDPSRQRPLDWAIDAPVHAKVGGARIWAGLLAEPAPDGTFHAYGLPVLADSTPALATTEFGLEPTVADAEALSEAIDRGSLPGWRKSDPFPGVSWGGEPEPGMMLSGLFDRLAYDHGLQWKVTPYGEVVTYPVLAGTPDWHVHVPGYRYGYDTTDLVTHLFGHYMKSSGGYGYTSVATGVQAARREGWVDLTDRGILDEPGAQDALLGIARSQGYAAPAPTEPISVGWGQLRTPGGQVVPAWLARGGETLRVWGASDGLSGRRYLDARIDTTEYDDETGTSTIQLAHASPRGFAAAMQEALSA